MAQIFRVDNPFTGKGLTLWQRICYANAMVHFFFGLPRLVFLTAPMAFLFFEWHIINAGAIMIALYVLPYILQWADSAAEFTGEQVYFSASQSHATRLASVNACRSFDYIISPTAPMPAFAAELPSPTNDPLHGLEHIGFTVPYNMSEQPAASINCGYTLDGLPIGLQIAGQRFDDLGVLQVARAFELIRDPQRPWPQPPV